ncbi:MAG: hypothetical protein ACRCUI_09540 [Polymorphobacter sp.]
MPAASGYSANDRNEGQDMGKGLILWILGVPGIIVILLLLFNVL